LQAQDAVVFSERGRQEEATGKEKREKFHGRLDSNTGSVACNGISRREKRLQFESR
jgi:hypothetical protein